MATAPQFVGREFGASDWVAVDQHCIDAFAACTGDRQLIHVDVERARLEIEGEARPALVAQLLCLLIGKHEACE